MDVPCGAGRRPAQTIAPPRTLTRMTTAIETRGLTKRYGHEGAAPALADLDLDVRRGRDLRLPGAERRRQDHGDPPAARASSTRPPGRATVLGLDIGPRVRGDPPAHVGYLPGGIAFWDGLTGERLLDELGGAVRPTSDPARAALLDRLELSGATLKRPVRDYSRGMRQKLGDRPGAAARPRAGDPRRAVGGPRSADAARVLRDPRRPARGGPDDLLLLARAVRGGAGLRSRGDHPARAASSRSRTSRRSSLAASGTSRCARSDRPRRSRA